MTPIEACQIISFYDGHRDAFNPCNGNPWDDGLITKYLSLDGLVPIWRKLQKDARKIDDPTGLMDFEFALDDYSGNDCFFIETNWGYIDTSESGNIQEAAAITTAKTIREVTNEKK